MLQVGHLNIYHLESKVDNIHNLLNNSSTPFHIYGFTESRLHPSIPDNLIHIPDYTVIRRDAQLHGETGIAVYVHNTVHLSTRRRSDLEHEHIECIWLEYKPSQLSSSVFVCFLYRNPASLIDWYEYFTEMLDKLYQSRPNADLLLLGDFNIDLLKTQSRWKAITSSLGLTQVIKDPTRVTQTSETLIDHIYTNSPPTILSASVSDLSISDHAPISCCKTTKIQRPVKNRHNIISFRSFKNFDQTAFQHALDSTPFQEVMNYTDPNEALDVWYNHFLSVLNVHAPVKTKRVKHHRLPQWLTPDIIKAMAERDKLKKSKLFPEYKKMRNKIKNLVRNSKRALFNKLIEKNKDTTHLWRALNTFLKSKATALADLPPQLTADVFNQHFMSVSSILHAKNTSPHVQNVNLSVLSQYCKEKTAHTSPFHIPLISVHEVGQYISNLDNKKSSGLDEISNYCLKIALPYIVEPLTFIFNQCFINNVFPAALKKAKVIPLYKSNNINDVNNYRPISLLPVLSKILERHVHNHLSSFIENHSLFHPFQSGFREHHSCASALSLLSNQWLTSMNNSEMSGTIFLDLSKAFDLVNHTILLQKLELYLNGSVSLEFFRSFLNDRTQKVLAHGIYSSDGMIQSGVPQGSVLGPILFCLYINDLPLHISNSSVECHMLADDTTLNTTGTNPSDIQICLQSALNETSLWCAQNDMIINLQKTKSMIIATRQKHQLSKLSLTLSVDGCVVEQVSDHKLLGIIIDDNLSWQSHINHVSKKLSKNLYLFSKLQSIISLEAKYIFYNAHIKSHLDYASVVWDGVSDNNFKKLNALHRRAAKLINTDKSLNTAEKIKSAGLLSLKDQLLFNKAVFMYKILNNNLPSYLSNLFRPSFSRYSLHKQRLAIPKPRIDIYKTCIAYAGVSVWNSLPTNIRMQSKLSSFKIHLRRHFLSIQNN